MLVKGTNEYNLASKLAKDILKSSRYSRWHENTMFNIAVENLFQLTDDLKQIGGFVGQVAESVEKKITPFGNTPAQISDKQAWILACGVVENNLKWGEFTLEEFSKF